MGTASLAAAVAGLAFGLSLIVAIGPQNTFVLRQGIRREHVALVVCVCTASDVAMIAAGTGGAGAAFDGRRWLSTGVSSIGVAFLASYAALAARRAVRGPQAPAPTRTSAAAVRATGPVLATCLALTWLNPGVYVDTIVVLGPVSHSHGGGAWWFAAGAMLASAAWFGALGVGARTMSPLFARPRAWRMLDAAVAVVMALTAIRLLVPLIDSA